MWFVIIGVLCLWPIGVVCFIASDILDRVLYLSGLVQRDLSALLFDLEKQGHRWSDWRADMDKAEVSLWDVSGTRFASDLLHDAALQAWSHLELASVLSTNMSFFMRNKRSWPAGILTIPVLVYQVSLLIADCWRYFWTFNLLRDTYSRTVNWVLCSGFKAR